MTPEEQRIAMAEFCGWKRETRRKWAGAYGVPGWGKNKHLKLGDRNRYFTTSSSYFPDYLNDLNAMHEAEKDLGYETWCIYRVILGDVVQEKQVLNWITPYNYVSASAAQRAEAFLKTVGRWKDE